MNPPKTAKVAEDGRHGMTMGQTVGGPTPSGSQHGLDSVLSAACFW